MSDLCPLRALSGLREWDRPGWLTTRQGKVTDLRPLAGLKLEVIRCSSNPQLTDLTPLSGKSLVELHLARSHVTDLTPLQGMTSLRKLTLTACAIRSLEPLRGLGLESLNLEVDPKRDGDVLRSLKSLKLLNDRPAEDALRELGLGK